MKKQILPPPKLKRKKSKATWVHAWAVPLAAWNLSSQKSLSSFLARANTPYLFCFILISWGCLTSPTFFFSQWANWLSQKKDETVEAPQNRRFYGKMEYLPLGPSYIHEKGRTLGQTYGIKVRCYWEHPWGTHCKPIGTWKEHDGNKGRKKKNLPPTQNLKEKKSRHFECMLSPPIGYIRFYFKTW